MSAILRRRGLLNIPDLIVFDYKTGGLKIPVTYTPGKYDYNLPRITSTYIVGNTSTSYSGWNTYYIRDTINITNYKYIYAEIKPNNSKNREFYLASNTIVTDIVPYSQTYIGVYINNKYTTTGINTKIAVKMNTNYIRYLCFTNNPPAGAVFINY